MYMYVSIWVCYVEGWVKQSLRIIKLLTCKYCVAFNKIILQDVTKKTQSISIAFTFLSSNILKSNPYQNVLIWKKAYYIYMYVYISSSCM